MTLHRLDSDAVAPRPASGDPQEADSDDGAGKAEEPPGEVRADDRAGKAEEPPEEVRADDRAGKAEEPPEEVRADDRAGKAEEPPEEVRADDRAGKAEEPPGKPRRKISLLRETAVVVVGALVLSFLLKTFLVQAFYIPSGSMEITLLKNDRILAGELAPGPFDLHRGDVVVFADAAGWLGPHVDRGPGGAAGVVKSVAVFLGVLPSDSQEHLVKRVIGLPGDEVACCSPEGKLTVNGTAITEPYVYPGDAPSVVPFDVVVPAGRLWVMGDHRSVSDDSRYNQGKPGEGFVAEKDVVGVAFVRTWPVDRIGLLRNPTQVFKEVPDP